MNKFEYKRLCPFKWYILENFPFIEYDFDALTNWQLFCKIGKEINKIRESENTVGTQVEDLTNAFISLQDYINNYFENLDVQDEINNKLDEMVEDGTLQRLLLDVLSGVKIITPRNYHIEDYSSGDFTLFKYNNKVMMIDTHSTTIWSGLLADLNTYNITHIDTLIITHYDTDHIGNLENLINNNFIDENTSVYLPNFTTGWEQYRGTEHDYIIALLNTNNITYEVITTENTEKYFANDLKLIFNNTDVDYYLTHPNGNNSIDYNDTSLMTSIYYHNISMFFGGDAGKTAIEHMMDLGYINHKYNLWKVCHHGNNNSANTFSEKYANIINPDFAIQYSCMKAQSENFYAENETKYFHKFNTKMYSTSFNEKNIILSVDENSINCIQGSERTHTNNILQISDIYVDSSYNGFIQDGTQEYPFHDIPECLISLWEKSHSYYNVHIANGEYCKNDYPANSIRDKIQISKANSVINLIGESVDGVKIYKNINIRNSSVSLQNLTFNVIMNIIPFESYFSKVSIRNCKFVNTTENVLNATFIANSMIDFIDVSFTNFDNCIRANRSQIIETNITSINNNTINRLENSNIQANNLSLNNTNDFTNTTNAFNLTNSKLIDGYLLMSFNSTGVTTIDLPFPKNNFSHVEIYYKTGDSITSTKVPSGLSSTLLSGFLINTANTAGYLYNALCTMNSQQFVLSRNRQINMNPTPGISFNEQNAIKIVKIIGY